MKTTLTQLEARVKLILLNLKHAIHRKEQLLVTLEADGGSAAKVCAQLVKINIDELKRIKADLEGK